MKRTERVDRILGVIHDDILDFVVYDRRHSDALRAGEIEAAIAAGELTVDDMVAQFRESLERQLVYNKRHLQG